MPIKTRSGVLSGFDMRLVEQLIYEEGLRLESYKCTAGHNTIGVGHNLDSQPLYKGNLIPYSIDTEFAYKLLAQDLSDTYAGLDKNISWFSKMPAGARQDALVLMAFQLGTAGVLKFKNMLRYIEHGQYENAALAALDSKWAKEDSPARAKRVAGQINLGLYYGIPNRK